MTETTRPDPVAIHQGLIKVRRCRWFLWTSLIVYLPGMWLALRADFSKETLTWLFGAWVALLCVAVGLATVAKCPRCGQQFHTNGPTFLPVRKCLHCGLHVEADKKVEPIGS